MPVVQCPHCQKSLNVKQMPAGGRVKCPGCGNAISVGGGKPGTPAAGAPRRPAAAKPAAARPNARPLTPEDEGFDFSQIRFPAAGPAAVSSFPTDPYSRTAYQGPIPGDPLGEYIGQAPPDSSAAGPTKGKPKPQLSPAAIAGILAGVFAFLLAAIVIGVVVTSGGSEEDDGGGEVETSGTPPTTKGTLVRAIQPVRQRKEPLVDMPTRSIDFRDFRPVAIAETTPRRVCQFPAARPQGGLFW